MSFGKIVEKGKPYPACRAADVIGGRIAPSSWRWLNARHRWVGKLGRMA
jgi:hypothetical protein